VALGVGLTTHTYSTVYGTVIRGIVVPDADRFIAVRERDVERGYDNGGIPYRDFLDLQAQTSGLESVAGVYDGTINLAGDDAPPERFEGAFVTANALSVVGIEPLLGRVFREGEDGVGATPRIVLSERVWRNRFAADPTVIGRTIRANGSATEIIGVMPGSFAFPMQADLWLPVPYDANADARRTQFLTVFGRLAEGLESDAVQASLARFSQGLAEVYPDDNKGKVLYTVPYAESYMPPEITSVFYLMLLATFGVLLIACANVANLLLARASLRSREVAIRTAMGASRWRVVRQMLAEVSVITALGGALGVVFAYLGVVAFNRSIVSIEKPYWIDINVDARALLFAFGVTAVASIVAGLYPALRASGAGMGAVLQDEGRGSSSLRLGRFSATLVITEVAVSCGLLIAAGFMIKSVANLKNMDLGFEPESVLVGRVGLFATDYPTPGDRVRFFEQMERRLAALPGVEAAALANVEPGLGGARWTVTIDGDSYETPRDYPVVGGNIVTSGYFEAIGTELLQDRDFLPSEAWEEADAVAIVNQSFVSRVLDGRDPLAQRVRIGGEGSPYAYARIIGVVADTYIGGGTGGIGDDKLDPEMMYVSPAAYDVRFMSAILKTNGPPAALAPEVRRVVTELDPNLPVYRLGGLAEAIDDATWAFGLFGSLFTIFGIAALFLAMVGLYGVMAFSVNQRRSEMGVRMALGAAPGAIRSMILGRGARQLGVGMGLGVGLGYLLAGPLSAVTFGVETTDMTVYGVIVLTLGLTGMLATIVPAISATRTDPIEAMRG
jgi:predicted permease